MTVEAGMIPVIVTNVLTAAVLGGILWNKTSAIEQATNRLREEIEEQNGRVSKLEQKWDRREGFVAGLEEDDG